MARTRRQKTLQEQESGVPASPPQFLPTAARPTRAKRTTARNDDDNNNTTAAPTEPPPSTRSGPAVRGGRIGKGRKVCRTRTQPPATSDGDAAESSATDMDGPEASDNLTRTEAALQATPTARTVSGRHDKVENMEELSVEPPGETHSPTNVPAQPVQSQDVTTPRVKGSTSPEELPESATSQTFREILERKSPPPSPSPGDLTAQTVASVVPLNLLLDPSVGVSPHTSESPRSRSPLTTHSVEATTPIIRSPASSSSLILPSIEVDDPVIRSPASSSSLILPSIEVDDPIIRLRASSSPSATSSAEISTPSITPSAEYFSPSVRSPAGSSIQALSSIPEAGSSMTGSPLLSSPRTEPVIPALSPASQAAVWNFPRDPEHSHSLITIRMDYFQGSKDPKRTSQPASFAVPSELVASFCKFIESRAAKGSDLSKITTDYPAVHAIVRGDARYRPQLPEWHSQQSPPSAGLTLKDAFLRKVQRKRNYLELEKEAATLEAENAKLKADVPVLVAENAKLKADVAAKSPKPPPKRTKTVDDPWTDGGLLSLGGTKEVEVDEHGVVLDPTEVPCIRWIDEQKRRRAKREAANRLADVVESPYVAEEIPDADGLAIQGLFAESQAQAQAQAQQEAVPETPRARGWGISHFLPSAQSVTKFIPFSSRLTPQQQEQALEPQQTPQNEPQVTASSHQPEGESDNMQSVADATQQQQPRSGAVDTVTIATQRRQQPKSKHQKPLTKQQSEEDKRLKKMRAQLRKEAAQLQKQKEDLENAKKELAEQREAQTPGAKRKRLPSPDVIPLPAGGGFGLVDEYFMVDSSSDEDVAAQETPSKEPPTKKLRTDPPKPNPLFNNPARRRPGDPNAKPRILPGDEPWSIDMLWGTPKARPHGEAVEGNPFRARPYTGYLFRHPDECRKKDVTPPPGPTLVFKVPSPGDSDSDDDEVQEPEVGKFSPSSSRTAPMPKSILRNSASNSSASSSSISSKPDVPASPWAEPWKPGDPIPPPWDITWKPKKWDDEDLAAANSTPTPKVFPPIDPVPSPSTPPKKPSWKPAPSTPTPRSLAPSDPVPSPSTPLSEPLAPPPRPNPSHATLPGIAAMAPSGALEKAREKALMYQPKQPSHLRESSRLSTSTVNSDPGDEAQVEEYDPKNPAIVSSPTKSQSSGDRTSSAASGFGQSVVTPTTSGFQHTPTDSGFQWPPTYPRLNSQVLSAQPNEQSQEQQAETTSETSGQQSVLTETQTPSVVTLTDSGFQWPRIDSGFQYPPTEGFQWPRTDSGFQHTPTDSGFQHTPTASASQQFASQVLSTQSNEQSLEQQAETAYETSAHADVGNQRPVLTETQTKVLDDDEPTSTASDLKVDRDIRRWWKDHGDEFDASPEYKAFEAELIADEQRRMGGPNLPYLQPRGIISAAYNRIGADGLADRDIHADVEGNWRPGDLERTESDPAQGMKAFFYRLFKRGNMNKDMADSIIAMGVPPGVTQHLAGQGVISPATV